jgi:hypothetical protein
MITCAQSNATTRRTVWLACIAHARRRTGVCGRAGGAVTICNGCKLMRAILLTHSHSQSVSPWAFGGAGLGVTVVIAALLIGLTYRRKKHRVSWESSVCVRFD